VDLPHDFVLLGDYTQEADGHHGYLPRNLSGWYRKKFKMPEGYQSSGSTWLHFEGIFQKADVWINGQHVRTHTSGYLGFDVSLDSASTLKHGGGENSIVIRVDASFGSGHWYEGGGVQRPVWLYRTTGTARFSTDGLFAQTAASSVTAARAVVVPTAEVEGSAAGATVRYTLIDPSGAVVGAAATPCLASAESVTAAGSIITVSGANITITNPQRWSVKTPVLYILAAELMQSGAVVDSLNTTMGLRSIDWSSAMGFALNDKPVHIRGFSHHSDFGGVGGAVPDRINVFRANALRSVGGNTWRTSHNPYQPAVYDILDTVGVLVWDENRDFNQLNTMDMERLVRRDR
jgi:beta-galactosidase/beta-glucuronidase